MTLSQAGFCDGSVATPLQRDLRLHGSQGRRDHRRALSRRRQGRDARLRRRSNQMSRPAPSRRQRGPGNAAPSARRRSLKNGEDARQTPSRLPRDGTAPLRGGRAACRLSAARSVLDRGRSARRSTDPVSRRMTCTSTAADGAVAPPSSAGVRQGRAHGIIVVQGRAAEGPDVQSLGIGRPALRRTGPTGPKPSLEIRLTGTRSSLVQPPPAGKQ